MGLRRLAAIGAALTMLATVVATAPSVGAQATEMCNGKPATIVGTDGDDRIEGTEGNDVIVGLSGKDVIFGRGGNDTICGGPGNDVIKGGRGNDYVEGNQGNDKLVGGIGKDTMSGGSAKDKVFGGGGSDILAGNSKRDFVNGQNGNDTCDLDPQDRWQLCEAGDVIAYSGVGPATIDIDIPPSFALSTVGGTQGLQTPSYYFGAMFAVWTGFANAELYGAGEEFSAAALNDSEDGPGDVSFTFRDPLDRLEVEGSTDASWTVYIPSSDAIPYVPRSFNASGPLLAQYEAPTAPGENFAWALDVEGFAFAGFISIVPGERPDFNVNELPDIPGTTTYTGDLAEGTRFLQLRWDRDHLLEVGPAA